MMSSTTTLGAAGLALASVVSIVSSANAENISAGGLREFCLSKGEPYQAACRFYILGVAQGYSFATHSAVDPQGQFVERLAQSACIPDIPNAELIDVVQQGLAALSEAFPSDMESSAVSVVTAILHKAYPCPGAP